MTQPQRIQRKRTKGYRMPENTVSVTRPGKWGNPFPVSEYGREMSIKMFRRAIMDPGTLPRQLSVRFQHMRDRIKDLQGKNLACFCNEGDPCHADVLLELANA